MVLAYGYVTAYSNLETMLSRLDVHVLHNGTSLFDADIDGYGGDPASHAVQGASPKAEYSGQVAMMKDDTITFAIGYGKNKTNSCDTTGLFAQVNADIEGGYPQSLTVSGGSATGQMSSAITYKIMPDASESVGQVVELDLTLSDTASGSSEAYDNYRADDIGSHRCLGRRQHFAHERVLRGAARWLCAKLIPQVLTSFVLSFNTSGIEFSRLGNQTK